MSYDRHDRAMDRYLTGNWGEGQFYDECECELPELGHGLDKFTCERCGTIWQYVERFAEWEVVGNKFPEVPE